MKIQSFIFLLLGAFLLSNCKSGKIITKAIAPRDTTKMVQIKSPIDSIILIKTTKENIKKSNIDFKTFTAKVRLDIETTKGVEPDAIANIKMIKDSVVWISITATFINLEVLRIYLFKDSIVVLDKQKHEVSYRTYKYLQDIINIPFDLKTVQDVIIGNPIFVNEQNITLKKYDTYVLISTLTNDFKNLLTYTNNDNLLEHCKLDDRHEFQNRTADFTYGYYNSDAGFPFSTYRQIVVTEKNKIDIRMNFKQYEFNKELSISYNVPKNYKKN